MTTTKKPSKTQIAAEESFGCLMRAVTSTHEWRERVLLSHGARPPTAYHRILLCLYVRECEDLPLTTLKTLAIAVSIGQTSIDNIIKRMAFDGLVSVTHDVGADTRTKKLTLTNEGRDMAIG